MKVDGMDRGRLVKHVYSEEVIGRRPRGRPRRGRPRRGRPRK